MIPKLIVLLCKVKKKSNLPVFWASTNKWFGLVAYNDAVIFADTKLALSIRWKRAKIYKYHGIVWRFHGVVQMPLKIA